MELSQASNDQQVISLTIILNRWNLTTPNTWRKTQSPSTNRVLKRVHRSKWGSESSRSSIESDYISILSENQPAVRKESIIDNLTKDIVQGSIIMQNKEGNLASQTSNKIDEVSDLTFIRYILIFIDYFL